MIVGTLDGILRNLTVVNEISELYFKEIRDKILNPKEQWTIMFAYFNFIKEFAK